MKKNIVTLTLIVVSSITFLSSCREKQAVREESKPVKVETIEAIKGFDREEIRASGKLSLKEEAMLSFKTGGIINRVYVNEGDRVKAGQLLAELKLSEINANVEQARLAFDKVQRDFKRVENLYRDSVATLEQFQNVSTALDYAKSNLTIAEFNREYSSIKAPANGRILRKLAQENEMKGPGNPVFVFASMEKEWVMKVNLSDRQFIICSQGDSADIEFDAYPGKQVKAVLSEKAGTADPYTGTYTCELTILNPDPGLVSGLIGKAVLFSSRQEEVIEIPYSAIVEANELMAEIYVVVDGKAESREIRLKRLGQDKVLVEKGLNAGDRVVIEGATYLKEGSIVEISNTK